MVTITLPITEQELRNAEECAKECNESLSEYLAQALSDYARRKRARAAFAAFAEFAKKHSGPVEPWTREELYDRGCLRG